MHARAFSRRRFLQGTALGLGAAAAGAHAAPQAADVAGTPRSPSRLRAALARLDALAAAETRSGAVPGLALAVVHRDRVVYARGFGRRNAAHAEPIDAASVFQLASVSKPIASTLVAILVGEKIVGWDTKLVELDPSFALHDAWVTREVTVRDMFCHRSGLPEHAGDLLEDLDFSRNEIVERLRLVPPASSFRTRYAYTNFGLTAAAVAAAKAAGLTWEALIEQKLFAPLGMTQSSARYADFAARANRALGHVRDGGRWVARYERNADSEAPAGGVSASLDDLARWLRLQLAGGRFEGRAIVDAQALAETHLPHMLVGINSAGLPLFYGLGWNVSWQARGALRLSHSGAFALGAGTAVYAVPSASLGVIALSNASPTGVPEGLCASFLDWVLEGRLTRDWLGTFKHAFAQMMAATEGGAKYRTPAASARAAAPYAAYAGRYANAYFGEIAIVEAGGGLAIVQGRKARSAPMTHYSDNTFYYRTEGESATGLAGVAFTMGPDGRAASVVVENLDLHGLGTFARVAM